ncbi:MAG: cation transporter [Oligoflexia bacterium]|nr:cation transporter [Oligoflexia bacterium]
MEHEENNEQLKELDHDHKNSSGHSHDISNLSGKKIFWVTVLNAVITIAEFVGGLISGSLALMSDSLHNLSDTIAIALSYFANRISNKPKNIRKTFGYKRAEILAAFINSGILVGISIMLIFEAYKRFNTPEIINGNLMIIVALIGLVANFISVYLLEKDSHENLNIKSSYLHLVSDTVSSVGVVIGGIVIKIWNIVWIDPLITILISIYILKETWHILKKTVDILMQASPLIEYDNIKAAVEKIDGVENIHHIHAWMMNEKTIYFEAHLDMNDMKISEAERIYDKIEHLLKEHYGIDHITLQAEVNRCTDKNFIRESIGF